MNLTDLTIGGVYYIYDNNAAVAIKITKIVIDLAGNDVRIEYVSARNGELYTNAQVNHSNASNFLLLYGELKEDGTLANSLVRYSNATALANKLYSRNPHPACKFEEGRNSGQIYLTYYRFEKNKATKKEFSTCGFKLVADERYVELYKKQGYGTANDCLVEGFNGGYFTELECVAANKPKVFTFDAPQKYAVEFSRTETFKVIVEAKSEEEAERIVRDNYCQGDYDNLSRFEEKMSTKEV